MNYLVKMFFAATLFVSAFLPFGLQAADQSAFCIPQFSRLGQASNDVQVQKILASDVAEQALLANDMLRVQAFDDARKLIAGTSYIQKSTLNSANALVHGMRDQLKEAGYIVRVELRPSLTYKSGGNSAEIPEREVLIVSAGTAKGKFARELRRFDKDTAARLRDPRLPKTVAEKPFGVSVDPLMSIALGTRGHFSVNRSYGFGAVLSPSLFAESEEIASEILRHELRHSKSYFDRMTGRTTINRANIDGLSYTAINPDTFYAKGFSVEELYASESNIRTAQADLGKLTEVMSKAMTSTDPPSEMEKRTYVNKMNEIRARGLEHAGKISTLNKVTLEELQRARSRLADPLLSPDQLAKRLSIFQDEMNPGVRRVAIAIDEDPSISGAILRIWIPENVTAKGNEAIREYAVKYCNDLEKHTKEVEKKNAIRMMDLKRDPMSRLKTPVLDATTP